MRRLGIALLLVAAACTGNGTEEAETTTTTAAPVVDPTTTTSTSTTAALSTTEAPEVRRIFGGTRLQPGERYRGALTGPGIEYELQVQLDGWEVEFLGMNRGDFIHFDNAEPSLAPGGQVGLIVWNGNRPPQEIADSFLAHENVADSNGPEDSTLAGIPAVQLDLLLTTDAEPRNADAAGACLDRFYLNTDRDINGELWTKEIVACSWNRIWVVDLDGVSLSVIVAAGFNQLDPDKVWQIEDFEPLLDDFINGLTLCATATPCDD